MRQWIGIKHTLQMARRPIVACTVLLTGVACLAPAIPAQTSGVTRTALTVATGPAASTPAVTQTTFTAHVTDMAGAPLAGTPDSSVTFDTTTASLGAARINDQGDATLTVTSLPAAEAGLAVHAVYHPGADSPTQASISTPALVSPAAAAAPDFTITVNPATVTVKQGLYVTTAVTITPLNGFSEQVTLSCSNLPAQVTCNFSPVIQTTASGAFTSTLELQTQTPSGDLLPLDLGRSPHSALAWVLPGALALAGLAAARRRAFRGAALVALLAATSLALGGCSQRYGYNHHPPVATVGTPTGNYTINIAASGNDGSAVTVHNISVALQVQ